MPYYAGIQPTTTAPETGGGVAAPEIFVPTWHAPDGETVVQLNAPRSWLRSQRAVGGIGAVPVDIVTTPNPDGGAVVEYVRAKERTIVWPLFMRGATHSEFLTLWHATIEAFTQTRNLGPGLLRIARPDGSQREIPAYYQAGFELDPSGSDGAWTYASAPLNLLCPSPWWRDVDPTPFYQEQVGGTPFLTSYPSVSSGAVLGDGTVVVDGSEAVWPSWTIRGPMTQLVATNTTRGESFTLTHTLTAGELITISSRPIQVRGPSDTNLINKLDLPTGKPWRLDPGSNSVSFTMTGAAAASGSDLASRVDLSFKQLRETA